MNKTRHFRNMLRVTTLLVMLVVILPAGTQGQASRPNQRFLETRINEPWRFSQCPDAQQNETLSAQRLETWQSEIIEYVYSGGISIDVDTTGRPHISYTYYDYDVPGYHTALKYAYRTNNGWHIEMVDSGSLVGQFPSLKLDTHGRPHISYYDGVNGSLKYACFDGSAWQIEIVDDIGNVGAYSSLALDTGDRPHISYLDRTNGDLKYAYHNGSTWQIEVVDSNGAVQGGISLALDTVDLPHIVYWSQKDIDVSLRYAHYDGSVWHIEEIDDIFINDESLSNNSLVLDASDRPHIVYYHHSIIEYAHYDGSRWNIEAIDNNYYNAIPSASLDLDVAGHPHISYQAHTVVSEHQISTHVLKYAYYNGSVWQIQALASPIYDNSIALDVNGQPHLVYSYGGALEYAVRLNGPGTWSQLAFASYRDMNFEVYTAQGDGTSPVRRTYHPATDFTPELNRGATQIVFVSNRDGNAEIYKMNADGSAQTRLTWNGANDFLPAWSPDGSRIAFYSNRDGNYEIYVMNADGSNQTRLTADPAWDGHPTWSPDGTQIAFSSDRGGAEQIWVMNADGTNQRPLSPPLSAAGYLDWSPDGSRIAFNDDANNDGWFDIAVINADGTGLVHPLGYSPDPCDYLAPSWAPNGRDLAFARIEWTYYQGNWYWVNAHIYGLDSGNSLTYPLVDSGYDWWPDWQTTDTAPPSSQATAPEYSVASAFTVRWTGSDNGTAGLRSYDVQYRDGSTGIWTDWLSDTTRSAATFTGQDGHTYYFRCRARDHAFNLEPYPDSDGDAHTTVDMTPPNSAASSPEYANDITFLVSWSGSDSTSGIASYDIQYRNGPGGIWTDWLKGTTATQAVFNGQLGHTYYFRCRARDRAGNLETYPGGDGDTLTHTPQYALSGHILGNREQPVALAKVEAIPAALSKATSRADGSFTLYFNQAGIYAVVVYRDGFGLLPPMGGIEVGTNSPHVTLYLPPADDRIAEGGFESGNLDAWHPSGWATPYVTTTAHTGDFAAVLGGMVPLPVITPAAPFSTSAAITEAGGLLNSPQVHLQIPGGAVDAATFFTLTGISTLINLPVSIQGVGLHFDVQATQLYTQVITGTLVFTGSHAITATLCPFTMTLNYDDTTWQDAQIAGEETLTLWWYDRDKMSWSPISGSVDTLHNTLKVATDHLGLFALAGTPSDSWSGVLEQEVTLSPILDSGTLSLLYRTVEAEPVSDTLYVHLVGLTRTVSYSLPLTTDGWVHRWWELPAWANPTMTVRLEWTQRERERVAGVILDEISLGTAMVGSYPVYLPLVMRNTR